MDYLVALADFILENPVLSGFIAFALAILFFFIALRVSNSESAYRYCLFGVCMLIMSVGLVGLGITTFVVSWISYDNEQSFLQESAATEDCVEGILSNYSTGQDLTEFLSDDTGTDFRQSNFIATMNSADLEYGNCSIQLINFQPPYVFSDGCIKDTQSIALIESGGVYVTLGLQFGADNKLSFVYVVSTSTQHPAQ